jgi:Na+:H+ antiporter, NhaA family
MPLPLRHRLANRLATALSRVLGGDAAAGVLLMIAAALALILANSPLGEAYRHALHAQLPFTPVPKLKTAHLWINDALMALFFFAVGLEIKRELLDGELSSPARRRLPVIAAVAGMAVPAAVYLALAGGDPALQRGWAIPAATDIAFAIGVLAIAGRSAPPSLRLLLLTIAIVDDMGAVAIIALFYTAHVDLAWLAGGAAALAAMGLLARTPIGLGKGAGWAYAALAIVAWLCTLHSGVHATVAGVLAALFVPLRLGAGGDSILLRMEHALAPWVAYLILPLFGLANAGAQLTGGWDELLAPLPLAIAAGLFVGKQAGILGAIWLAVRLGIARRPAGASWLHLWGVALLCGIGFTMSLFIAGLAFPGAPGLAEAAKLGILAGSLLSALLGYGVLRAAASRT